MNHFKILKEFQGCLSPSGCISDTRTPKQKEAMKHLILDLHHRFPGIRTILGHRDLPGVQKACPCFDATKLQYLLDASWFSSIKRFFKSRIPLILFNKLGRIQSGCALPLCRHISFIQHSSFTSQHSPFSNFFRNFSHKTLADMKIKP